MRNEVEEEVIEVLSFPEKGEFHNSTFFTTTNELKYHLRIYKGSMENIKGFIITSDGSDEAIFDRRENKFSVSVWRLFDWLFDYSEEKVESVLHENIEKFFRLKTMDDCSVGLLICVN